MLRSSCPKFLEFYKELLDAHNSSEHSVTGAAKRSGLDPNDFPVGSPSLRVFQDRILELAAKSGVLEKLIIETGAGGAAARPKADAALAIYRDVPCRFASWSPESEEGPDYLECGRDVEWKLMKSSRKDAIDPLFLLGPDDEALDLLQLRVERWMKPRERLPVASVGWDPACHASDMLKRLLDAVAAASGAARSSASTLASLLAPQQRIVVLQQLVQVNRYSAAYQQRLAEYYQLLGGALAELLQNRSKCMPIVVQPMTWTSGASRSDAEKLVASLRAALQLRAPGARGTPRYLEMIPTPAVHDFLDANNRLDVWDDVNRRIHRVPGPFPILRKPSRAVYTALEETLAPKGPPNNGQG